MRRIVWLLLTFISVASPALAQGAPERDFDYLLGDWQFTAKSKEWGTFQGFWSALRLADGQILDEYRIVDDSLRTIYVTTTFRNYNKRLNRWELIGADAGGGLLDFGTAQRMGDEMHIEQRFDVGGEMPSLWRIRYYSIQPDRFSWTANRSTDEGKSWVEQYLQIEARRIGPSRSLPSLAPPRK